MQCTGCDACCLAELHSHAHAHFGLLSHGAHGGAGVGLRLAVIGDLQGRQTACSSSLSHWLQLPLAPLGLYRQRCDGTVHAPTAVPRAAHFCTRLVRS